MKNLLTATLFVLVLLTNTKAYTQTENSEAQIITQSADTLEGYVHISREDEYVFTQKIDQKGNVLSPARIKTIIINQNEIIKSKEIDLNDEKQLKFLQQLVEGNTSLFRLPNNKEYAYWVEDKDGNVYALSNVKLESKRDGKKYIRYTNTYKGILKNVFRDQPDLFNEIDKLKYSDIALINLFQKYHELTNQPLKVNFTKRRDVALAWGIIAGLQYSSIKFTGTEELESYLSPTFSNSSNFSFGFFTEAQPVESRHSAYKIAFQYQSAFYSNPTLSLSTNILRVTPAYKYLILPNGKFKPYISLGPAFNFLLSLKDQSIYDELDLKWLQSGSIQYGLEAVAGVSKSINDNYGLFLELRYGMYNGNHLTSSRRFVAGVGYVPIQDSFDSISNSFGILGGFTFY